MSKRLDCDVTLTHEEAQEVARILADYASNAATHARKTRVESVRASQLANAARARNLAQRITANLWVWQATGGAS